MAKAFPRTLWILPLGLMVVLLWAFPHWTVDDAYISYRYGLNWLETGEWVWNKGDAPVEGFTGFFLPMAAAATSRLGLPLEMSLRILGFFAAFGTLLLLGEILRVLKVNEWIAFLTVLLFSVQPWLYVHAGSGLETSVFLFILALHVYAVLRIKVHAASFWQVASWGLTAMLAAWVRPEGILLAVASVVTLVGSSSAYRLKWLLTGGAFLALIFAFQVWRYSYFGSWMPLSVVAKSYPGIVNPEAIKDFVRFFMYFLAVPALLGFGLFFMEMDGELAENETKAAKALRRRIFWMAVVFIVPSLFVYGRSHLFMNYAGRFFVPMAILVLPLAACGADYGWARFSQSRTAKPARWRLAKWILAGFFFAQAGLLGAKWRSEWYWVQRYSAIMEGEYRPAAHFLKSKLQPKDRVVCYQDAGAIPFFSGASVVDFGRLNDPALARMQTGSQAAVDYFFDQHARFAVFTSYFPDRYVYIDEAHAIHSDPRFARYSLMRVFSASGVDDYFQFVYELNPPEDPVISPDSAGLSLSKPEILK